MQLLIELNNMRFYYMFYIRHKIIHRSNKIKTVWGTQKRINHVLILIQSVYFRYIKYMYLQVNCLNEYGEKLNLLFKFIKDDLLVLLVTKLAHFMRSPRKLALFGRRPTFFILRICDKSKLRV